MYLAKTPFLAKYLFSGVTWRIRTSEKIIYLSFDDGPTHEITEWTLETLKIYNAKASFFCVGKNVEQHPGIFQKILSEGHAVGNHTHNHVNGWKTRMELYLEDVKKCEKAIGMQYSVFSKSQHSVFSKKKYSIVDKNVRKQHTGYQTPNPKLRTQNSGPRTTKLFRPPYGKILKSQISNLKSQYSIIMWDVISGDFDQRISEEQCFKNVVKNAGKGSIVVFHDSIKASRNLFYALPRVLEYFGERGYAFEKL